MLVSILLSSDCELSRSFQIHSLFATIPNNVVVGMWPSVLISLIFFSIFGCRKECGFILDRTFSEVDVSAESWFKQIKQKC